MSRCTTTALRRCTIPGRRWLTSRTFSTNNGDLRTHSIPDQTARFARAQAEGNERFLDITSVYDGNSFKGKRVLVTGGNRGLGLDLATELASCGASVLVACRSTSKELDAVQGDVQIIEGVDVQHLETVQKMVEEITDPIHIVINNAGYFPDLHETITDEDNPLNFEEALKQIDICALGPLRVISQLHQSQKFKTDGTAKAIIISSQAGSAAWRFTQNQDEGGDYGHHMCRAACNIGGVLMSEELKRFHIPVVMLHPGFNRTEMTRKYEHIWDIEGAVESHIGAKRVLHEIEILTPEDSGMFINCEDGLQIPW